MGDAARVIGLDNGIQYKGKTYALADMCMEIRAAFEMWLEDRAWKAVLRSERSLPEDRFRQQLGDCRNDIAAGVYSFYEETAERSRETIIGHAQMLLIRLRMANPGAEEITEDFVTALMEEKGKDVIQSLLLKDLDPKGEAPEGANP